MPPSLSERRRLANAKIRQMRKQQSRDLLIESLRTSDIRKPRSFQAWLKRPGLTDLIDSKRPKVVYDGAYAGRKKSPRGGWVYRAPGEPEPRKKTFVARLERALRRDHQLKGLRVRKVRPEDKAEMEALCYRPNCFEFSEDELETYLDFSKWKVVIERDGEIVGTLIGSPSWNIGGGGPYTARAEGAPAFPLDKSVLDKTAYLVLVCAKPGQGLGGPLVKSFAKLARQQGAEQLVMDVGGVCGAQLVSFYRRHLPGLTRHRIVGQGRRQYRGVWGDAVASIYLAPLSAK